MDRLHLIFFSKKSNWLKIEKIVVPCESSVKLAMRPCGIQDGVGCCLTPIIKTGLGNLTS